MTSETLPAITEDEREHRRKDALLKALGLDKVPPEQRELALNIAKRYDLDLLLRHVILIDGRPYITRDGLLWVAHRSGQLDGIEVSDPEVIDIPGTGKFWRASCSVYRKDMSRPITYAGRYPTSGGNQKYAPEMAVKVAEVMALRRAFNVSAPVIEERWDHVPQAEPAEPKPDLSAQIAARREQIISSSSAGALGESEGNPEPAAGVRTVADDADIPEPADAPPGAPTPGGAPPRCESFHAEHGACKREGGHKGNHQNADRESWR